MSKLLAAARICARHSWLLRNRGRFADQGPPRRARLLVDVSVISRHDAHTGIQRVVRAVLSELQSKRSPHFDVVPVLATQTSGYRYASTISGRSCGSVAVGDVVSVAPGDKFLGLDLAAHLLPKYRAQLRAWRRHGATIHIVVYDLLPVMHPQWFNASTVRNFSKWLELFRGSVDQALCISDQVSAELVAQLGEDASSLNIGRLQLAGDIAASIPTSGRDPAVDRVLERTTTCPAVLMVGTVEPRKAHEVALDTFEKIWRERREDCPDLIIVGKPGWKTAPLQQRLREHPELGRRLHWLENVSDEALVALYRNCRGVLLTSHAEGFGLPAVEAAMHGRWMLVRDLPVFREQNLPNLRFFSDDSPEMLAEKILELPKLTAMHAPPAAKLATWSECIAQLVEEVGLTRPPSPSAAIAPRADRQRERACARRVASA